MIINDIKNHFPGKSYSNRELLNSLNSMDHELNELIYSFSGKDFINNTLLSNSFFPNLGVEYRNILCDPSIRDEWWQENAGKDPFALQGAIAFEKLMKDKEPLRKNDRIIVISNVSDTTAPHFGYGILAHVQNRNENFVCPSIISLQGEGCSGFISGLFEADLYLSTNADAKVVILAVEMMATPIMHPSLQHSLVSYAKNAKKEEYPLLCKRLIGLGIQRYLFGDGCSVAYCTNQDDGIKFNHFFKWFNLEPEDRKILEVVGIGSKPLPHVQPFGFFSQQPDKLFNRLISEYMPIVKKKIKQMKIKPQNYAIHTGSGKILKFVQKALDITDNQMEASRDILRQQGNMNAATGPAILARLFALNKKEHTAALFFGLGFALQLAT